MTIQDISTENLEKYFEYLDELRESRVTNMFGAARYLESRFPELAAGSGSRFHSSDAARLVLSEWMGRSQ